MKKAMKFLVLLIICFVLILVIFKPTLTSVDKVTRQIPEAISESVKEIVEVEPEVILPDPEVIVKEIQQMAKLETVSVTLERVIRGKRDTKRLWGACAETMIFVAHGKVIAGIDLNKLKAEDIEVISVDSIRVNLPKAEILSVSLDNKKSYVASDHKEILAQNDSQFETRVRAYAQKVIEENALELDILETANKNSQGVVENLLLKLGVKRVEFVN